MDYDKVKLDACQQIEHLNAKGDQFDHCSEKEAPACLKAKNFYFKLTAYRKLFDKYEGGRHDGEYIDLDENGAPTRTSRTVWPAGEHSRSHVMR